MQSQHADSACCGRCAGSVAAARTARRRHYRAAVFPGSGYGSGPGSGRAVDGTHVSTAADHSRAVIGTLLDVSPHLIVLGLDDGEHRITLTAGTAVWRGGASATTQLRPGERVVARLMPGRRDVADKIWASIGRVTGTITGWDSGRLLVDEGATRRCQVVIISAAAANRIRVRFPLLEPGSLIDVIGLRRGAVLEALLPATSQPAYLAARVAGWSGVSRPAGGTASGSATWHEPAEPAEERRGLAYPAIDPAAGCAEAALSDPGTPDLPYLAVGSMLLVRNECAGAARLLPVTGCGTVARLFHDRCMTCGTSPRGRVADLTLASFVELGGDLERGCFNATIATGW